MRLSKRTLEVLSNFAGFNDNILINPGQTLTTMTEKKNVFATAKVEETFPVEVPIYNLPEFLKAIALFDDPEFDFGEKFVTITDSNSKGVYTYAEKSVITFPPRMPNFPGADVEFHLPRDKFAKVLKAAAGLGLPNITLLNENGNLYLRAHDVKDDSSNKYDVIMDKDTTGHDPFQLHFLLDTLKMFDVDYDVKASMKGIASFENEKEGLSYLVALKAE